MAKHEIISWPVIDSDPYMTRHLIMAIARMLGRMRMWVVAGYADASQLDAVLRVIHDVEYTASIQPGALVKFLDDWYEGIVKVNNMEPLSSAEPTPPTE